MEPRTITLPVTFQVGSRPTLGPPAGGSHQVWATLEVPDDRRGDRSYALSIGVDVGNTRMTAKARHDDRRYGDRRLNAQADLAPFVEALFDKLAELLERPVFACCDQPDVDREREVCQGCGASLDIDQIRALVDCEHPTVADQPAGERSPCPDCGLVWCQSVGMIRAADMVEVGPSPCPRAATGGRSDGMTMCTTHGAVGDAWMVVTRASDW
jgi:hypothetical protein